MATSKNVAPSDKLIMGKAYRPAKDTMDDTQRTWITVQELMAANTGGITRKELTANLKEQYNHGSFVEYAIRRGWLVAK